MYLKNTNPLGQVDVPLLRRQGEPFDQEGAGCLEPGEVFECSNEVGNHLLQQVGNYEQVADADASKAPAKTEKKGDA